MEKSKGMQKFWEAIDSFRPKRKSKVKSITKHQWLEHFRKLLGNEGEIGKNRKEIREGAQVINEEYLDREIRIGKMKLAVNKMKNNKAAGKDGLTIEFSKGLTGGWMEELREI